MSVSLLVCAAQAGKCLCHCRHVAAQLLRHVLRLVQEKLQVPSAGAHSAAEESHDTRHTSHVTRHTSRATPTITLTCSNLQRSPSPPAAASHHRH